MFLGLFNTGRYCGDILYIYKLYLYICMCGFNSVCVYVCIHILDPYHPVGYTTNDLQFMWQTGDPVQMDNIALPQFDIRQEDIDYGNCTKFYSGTGTVLLTNFLIGDISSFKISLLE